jgi:hypothetical protein
LIESIRASRADRSRMPCTPFKAVLQKPRYGHAAGRTKLMRPLK